MNLRVVGRLNLSRAAVAQAKHAVTGKQAYRHEGLYISWNSASCTAPKPRDLSRPILVHQRWSRNWMVISEMSAVRIVFGFADLRAL